MKTVKNIISVISLISIFALSGCSLITPVNSGVTISFAIPRETAELFKDESGTTVSDHWTFDDVDCVMISLKTADQQFAYNPVLAYRNDTGSFYGNMFHATFEDVKPNTYELDVAAYKIDGLSSQIVAVSPGSCIFDVSEGETVVKTIKLEFCPKEYYIGTYFVCSSETVATPEMATRYKDLDSALAAISDSENSYATIVLAEDASFKSTIVIKKNVTIVPYLSDVTLTADGANDFNISTEATNSAVLVKGGSLTLKGNNYGKKITLSSNGLNTDSVKYFIWVIDNEGSAGTLELKDGSEIKDVTVGSSLIYAGSKTDPGSNFILDGGKITDCTISGNGNPFIKMGDCGKLSLQYGEISDNTVGDGSEMSSLNCVIMTSVPSFELGTEADSGKQLKICNNIINGRCGTIYSNHSSPCQMYIKSNVEITENKIPSATGDQTTTAGIMLAYTTLIVSGTKDVKISGNTGGYTEDTVNNENNFYYGTGSGVFPYGQPSSINID